MKSPSDSVTPRAPEAEEERDRLREARSGSHEAFRWLVERYQSKTYGLALSVLKSPDDAEEAAQDAFVRAWRALPGFRGDAKFSTWLYRITVRCSLDRREALQRQKKRESDPTAADSRAGLDEANAFDATLRHNQVERLMNDLTPDQRAAVTLFYLQDRSVDDVALALELPVGTVKSLLSRARQRMRTTVRRDGGAGS